jgi:hypothetical protein
MLDKIKSVLENGQEMRMASKAGVRTIVFSGQTIADPLNEVASYVVENSFSGRITMRLFSDKPMGYVQHKKNGIWEGNNKSYPMEMTPIDPTVWANLKNYQPPKKVVEKPYVEKVAAQVEFDMYEKPYDWEPSNPEAVVVLVHHSNSKILEMKEALSHLGNRDLIIEVDGLPNVGRVELVKQIKEAYPTANVVEHGVQFGLGRLAINAHNNCLKYLRTLYLTDDLNLAPGIIPLAFNLHSVVDSTVAMGGSQSGGDIDSYVYGKTTLPLTAHVMSSKQWLSIKKDMEEYKKTFLITKYESRPQHSIRKWVKEKYKQLGPETPTGVFAVMSFALGETYAFDLPRATTIGQPHSDKSDLKRKKFTLAGETNE